MKEIVIFDTEHWTDEGVMARYWTGIDDPSPLTIQIGAVRIRLDEGFTEVSEFMCLVKPTSLGKELSITQYFTDLTKITQEDVNDKGLSVADAMAAFKHFCNGAHVYSYGEDFRWSILPTCYENDIVPPIEAARVHDIRTILRSGGMSEGDISKTNSGALARLFGVEEEGHWQHDARDDARSICAAMRVLQKRGTLTAQHFLDLKA